MKKSLMIFFVWMFGWMGLAWAESAPGGAKTLRLQWVIDETLKNNPNIQVFLNRWEASQEAITRAKSLDDPMVNFHTWNVESPVRVTPDWNRAERRGVISQKVPFPGKLHLRGKIAEGDSNIAKKDWEQQVLEMLARVKGTYYQLRHLYNVIDINKEIKDLLERFAAIAETRYKVGRAPQRDVLATQVEIARIIRDIEVLERDKKALETRINTILNRDPEAPLGRREDYSIYPLSLDLVELTGRWASAGGPRGSLKIVANLPYGIASILLIRALELLPMLRRAVVTLQAEVADRITARPASKAYGALTVAVQYRAEAHRVMRVPPGAFYPRPEVDSTVLRLDVLPERRVRVRDESLFFAVVRAAFGQRRKVLRNALAGVRPEVSPVQVEAACRVAGIDPRRRGETLSLDAFAALADALFEMGATAAPPVTAAASSSPRGRENT